MAENITGEDVDEVEYMEREEQIRELIDTTCPMIHTKVDGWLEKKPNNYLEALFQLADGLKMKQWMCKDADMYIFMKMCHVSKKEQQYHLQPIISKFHSMEEMKRIYRRTVLYIRRIELKLPKELCEDFYDLVKEWDFSPYYIWEEIILDRLNVYDVLALVQEVIVGLAERGRKKDAEIMYAAACDWNRSRVGNE